MKREGIIPAVITGTAMIVAAGVTAYYGSIKPLEAKAKGLESELKVKSERVTELERTLVRLKERPESLYGLYEWPR